MLRGLSVFYPYTYGRDSDETYKWSDQLLIYLSVDISRLCVDGSVIVIYSMSK